MCQFFKNRDQRIQHCLIISAENFAFPKYFCTISQLIQNHLVLKFKLPRDDGGRFYHFRYVLSVSVQAAVLSGGGSCDGGFVAPSVCPASGQTAAVHLAQLHPGSHTPWTAGPGSVPAFSQHSWLPAGTHGLQDRDAERDRFIALKHRRGLFL